MKAGAATLTLDCDMGAFLRSMSRAAGSVTRYRLRKVSLGRDRRMREVEFEESWGKFIPIKSWWAMAELNCRPLACQAKHAQIVGFAIVGLTAIRLIMLALRRY